MSRSAGRDNPSPLEPQLKYEPLQGDVPAVLGSQALTCLCLSDKILATGTEDGAVHVLDYSGNQVRELRAHKQAVCDLSFDAAGEYVASCSKDRSVVITSLYSDTVARHEFPQPVQSVALDPRYASRKTRELAAVLGDTGAVQLSSQGWLGRASTSLSSGPGTQLVRWWGHLIAWITGNALMVYSTVQHLLIRKFQRPSKGGAAAYRHASLLWGQNGYLYASWPDCILVARTYMVENSVGAAIPQIEVMAQWQPQQLVLGVSPFGHDLAVLTFQSGWSTNGIATLKVQPTESQTGAGDSLEEQGGAPGPAVPASTPQAGDASTAGTAAEQSLNNEAKQEKDQALLQQAETAAPSAAAAAHGQTGQATPSSPGHVAHEHEVQDQVNQQQQETTMTQAGSSQDAPGPEFNDMAQAQAQLQLRIMTLQGAELACDTLDVPSLMSLLPGDRSPYALVPSLPATTAAATDKKRLRKHGLPTSGLRASSSHTAAQQARSSVGGDVLSDGTTSVAGSVADHDRHDDKAVSRQSSGQLSVSTRVSEHGSSPLVSSTPRSGPSKHALATATHEPKYDEDAEFMYFVTTPQAVLVGRMRDLSDHVEWLCSHGQWEAALTITEERPRLLKPDVPEKVVQGHIGALLSRGAWEEAAMLSPRLMRGQASMWERWAYMFAQARQLPLLARVLPIDNPHLSQNVYDMVLTSLLANPQDHATAIELVEKWPAGCFNAPALVQAVVSRVNRTGQASMDMAQNEQLWRLLAHLYESQGRPDLALSILLELRDMAAFTFIAGRHEGLLAGLTPKRVAALVALDPPRAIRLLVRHADVVPSGRVVPALQEAMSVADDEGDKTARDKWRRALWSYLAALHDADPAAASPYSELQVSLTADYAPGKLLELLSSSSSSIPLESALAICEEKGLVAEQVFILGRMGNALRALHLIIDQLADIPQAIEFVEGQGDEELWEQLINWALSSPETTGSLLDHIGGHLNPLALVKRIPHGLTIPRLRDRIRSIIADFRTQTSLREGCNVILRADCARLVTRLQRLAAAAIPSVYLAPSGRAPTSQTAVNELITNWGRLDLLAHPSVQMVPDIKDIPATVAMAATSMPELHEVHRQPGKGTSVGLPMSGMGIGSAVTANLPAGVKPQRSQLPLSSAGIWVGCLPTQSSEDTVTPASFGSTEATGLGSPGGKPVKSSSHPYAVRKRLQAIAAADAKLAGSQQRGSLGSLVF